MFDSYAAPNGRFAAKLDPVGEIRFGPPYFSLKLLGVHFGERVFGDSLLFSPDSRYLAIQEWLTTDEATGPYTQLLLIDCTLLQESAVSQARKGFIIPKSFEADKIIYVKNYAGEGLIQECEMDLATLKDWRPLGEKRSQR